MMSIEDRRILLEAKKFIIENKNLPGGMEKIRLVMNKVYKHFKRVIPKADFNDKRLVEVFSLERLLSDVYLPLKNEPIYDPNRKEILPPNITTEKDCVQMMEVIVHRTRKSLSEKYDLKTASLEQHCVDTSWEVESVCKKLGVQQTGYSCSQNLGCSWFHCFNVVSFELPNGEIKYYLVDCTYRQFFTYSYSFLERIGMPYNSGPSIGAYMMMDERRKQIAGLLNNFFI